MTITGVPFHPNTPTDNGCFQASLRMVLEYFRPERSYTWSELDTLTAHTGDSTWPMAGALFCQSLGFAVTWIDGFDLAEFTRRGYEYLRSYYGQAIADTQRRHSDLDQERRFAGEVVERLAPQVRVPTRDDLKSCIVVGSPVICNVNGRALSRQQGYMGHFVVVYGIGEDGVQLHDPGLPPAPDRCVDWATFDDAWSYPDRRYRNLLALSLPPR